MLKTNTKFLASIILLGSLLTVTGCSQPTPGYDVPYNDETFSIMAEDIEHVVCSVSGQTVMTEKNVEDFSELSDRVEAYEGEKEKEASQVASMLKTLADDWEVTLGADLGEQNAEELTDLCNGVKGL